MAGYDQHVYETICKVRGHMIGSQTESVADMKGGGYFTIYKPSCGVCGMDLEEIRTMKVKRTRTSKPKDATQEPTE